ncbi:MAG: helix-turn-helix domain-containing protein [Microbacteriaceae bacterium]
MGRTAISLRAPARDALQVLGSFVHERRVAAKYTAEQAGERIGVSARTWRLIEHGSPTVSAGHVFNAAAMLDIPLFSRDAQQLRNLAAHRQQVDALIPARARVTYTEFDDDF